MIAHVFVDAENIPPYVTFKVVGHFGREHTITKVDIIGKEETLAHKYRNLDETLYRIQNCFYGKNSAVTWLCLEMVRAIIDEPNLELIIIISSDKDFLPAIKFAVDFDKKIIFVSDGASHRRLIEQLQRLEIPPAAIELKDFHLSFDPQLERLSKFFPKLTEGMKRFFMSNAHKLRFILVRRGEEFVEIPFVDGMGSYYFGRTCRELNILEGRLKNFIEQNFLKLKWGRVYFMTEEELAEPRPAERLKEYFTEHAADVRKILIKHGEKVSDLDFVDGMPFEFFAYMLKANDIAGDSLAARKIAKKSLLAVRDDKVFLMTEDELEQAYYNGLDEVDKYFYDHAAEAQQIFIKHNDKIWEVPFVNGMPFAIFGKYLRKKKIIGKSASPFNTAAKSLLAVRDDKVFLMTEDELDTLQDPPDSVGEYLDKNAAGVRTISIQHNGQPFEVPFVDGMPLATFHKLLLERKIIGKKASITKVALKNSLAVRDKKVFIREEIGQ
ncbi:MAG: NYN domain-containing protein [Selenomonadaceae bacterium]|nr:NYN domain-containing protein [Selenomonadaceae bacterium]